jgi:hypothetical protein
LYRQHIDIYVYTGLDLQAQIDIVEEYMTTANNNISVQLADAQVIFIISCDNEYILKSKKIENYQVLPFGQPSCWRLAEASPDSSSKVD